MKDRPIRFRFNAKKAAEAAKLILWLSGGRRNYMELVKLLYLADREALIQFGHPITGDRFAALPHGMILSRILNLIRLGPADEDGAPWFEVVSAPIGYDVKSRQKVGENCELSGAEENILRQVFEKYGQMDWKQLSRLTHDLPEWVDPKGGSLSVSPEQILTRAGKADAIEHLRNELMLFDELDKELESFGAGAV